MDKLKLERLKLLKKIKSTLTTMHDFDSLNVTLTDVEKAELIDFLKTLGKINGLSLTEQKFLEITPQYLLQTKSIFVQIFNKKDEKQFTRIKDIVLIELIKVVPTKKVVAPSVIKVMPVVAVPKPQLKIGD